MYMHPSVDPTRTHFFGEFPDFGTDSGSRYCGPRGGIEGRLKQFKQKSGFKFLPWPRFEPRTSEAYTARVFGARGQESSDVTATKVKKKLMQTKHVISKASSSTNEILPGILLLHYIKNCVYIRCARVDVACSYQVYSSGFHCGKLINITLFHLVSFNTKHTF